MTNLLATLLTSFILAQPATAQTVSRMSAETEDTIFRLQTLQPRTLTTWQSDALPAGTSIWLRGHNLSGPKFSSQLLLQITLYGAKDKSLGLFNLGYLPNGGWEVSDNFGHCLMFQFTKPSTNLFVPNVTPSHKRRAVYVGLEHSGSDLFLVGAVISDKDQDFLVNEDPKSAQSQFLEALCEGTKSLSDLHSSIHAEVFYSVKIRN